MSEAQQIEKHWTDGAIWHIIAWLGVLTCGLLPIGMVVIGGIRASHGRGLSLLASACGALVASVLVGIAVRML